jgi:hypothetical protein
VPDEAVPCDSSQSFPKSTLFSRCVQPLTHPQDFNAPKMARPHHFNSFATAFFVTLELVEQMLAVQGAVALISPQEERALEGAPLRCHGCGAPQPSVQVRIGRVRRLATGRRLHGSGGVQVGVCTACDAWPKSVRGRGRLTFPPRRPSRRTRGSATRCGRCPGCDAGGRRGVEALSRLQAGRESASMLGAERAW